MGINSIELAGPLKALPPVDFCCAYGSSLLSNNTDKSSMVDYIIGVADPEKWHAENFERNKIHYSRWMSILGPKMITCVADKIGVGVHFNPFVEWRDKIIKYGVVRMQDLALDILTWDRFYLSGRLQKPMREKGCGLVARELVTGGMGIRRGFGREFEGKLRMGNSGTRESGGWVMREEI
ncbi:hypothetical protein MA16_Dca021277 [Dendrobium catenatum]|uniref:Phosphatidate cytidylyltransferase, mitochondrial n=1 Tax=Dendrobium catenatum TaxID=906689 RepID=A0A2I0W5L5_9ASPA|nr:hypothetical protein MA16_Dca021277 [Dendrobium catenatum]